MFSKTKKRTCKVFYPFFLAAVIVVFLITGCAPRQERTVQIVRPPDSEVVYDHYGSLNLRLDDTNTIDRLNSRDRMRSLKRRGFNTITLNVFHDFQPLVPLQTWNRFHLPSVETHYTAEELDTFIQTAHQEGIAVWMSITALPVSTSVKQDNPDLYKALKRWFMENRYGNHEPLTEPNYYLCPQHPLVKQFYISLIDELYANHDFQGIVLSGIQYPFLSPLSHHAFCLCRYCTKSAYDNYGLDLTEEMQKTTEREITQRIIFYNRTLKDFMLYLKLARNMPPNTPFIVEILGDYHPYQNPYYQDYIYWSDQTRGIEFLFSFRSLSQLRENIRPVEMNIPSQTLLGIQVTPDLFRGSRNTIHDFLDFALQSQPYSTIMVDARNLSSGRIDSLMNPLPSRNILYPWNEPMDTVETILRNEHQAEYLSEMSQERIALIYTYLHKYLQARSNTEREQAWEQLNQHWMRATHLINIKNSPALKNLQLAYKYFYFSLL